MNSRSRPGPCRGRGDGISVSRPRKNEVRIRSKSRPCARHSAERPRDVGLVHEAVADGDLPEALARARSTSTRSSSGTYGTSRDAHGHAAHALVQHLVVLEVVQQRVRHDVGVAGHEHGRARHPDRRVGSSWSMKLLERQRVAVAACSHRISRPRRQVDHDVKIDGRATASGNQPPSAILSDVGGEEGESIDQEAGAERPAPAPRPPAPARSRRRAPGQHGRDHHRAGDRDAVGRGQGARGAEAEHQRQHADQQQPVDPRHVDLADLARRGVARLHARQVAELHRLRVSENAPEITACDAMTVATVASADQRVEQPSPATRW